MNILYYNWVDYDDKEKRGGGVSVYQNNIIKENKLDTLYFVSSGMEYDLFKKNIYYKKEQRDDVIAYSIVNSPVISPAHAMYNNLDITIDDELTRNVFRDIINDIGALDVVHFNNLEGIGINVLELKKEFPNIKFIFSAHNYYPLCPQVNLWKLEKENCLDNNNGKDCIGCVKNITNIRATKINRALHSKLSKVKLADNIFINKLINFSFRTLSKGLRGYRYISNANSNSNINKSNIYKEYIDKTKLFINENIDSVLCVSERVRDIYLHRGISPEKLNVDYIGTRFAKTAEYIPNKVNEHVTFCYLGYMRRDKGFYFLLESLEHASLTLTKKINIIIAARFTDSDAVDRLNKIKDKFNNFELLDGYDHNSLPTILSRVNVGIVPVLWEDNLPQVAIEYYANGVAVLSSDLGGSQELSKCNSFVFKSGNKLELIKKIEKIVNNKEILEQYFHQGINLVSMKMHLDNLHEIYK